MGYVLIAPSVQKDTAFAVRAAYILPILGETTASASDLPLVGRAALREGAALPSFVRSASTANFCRARQPVNFGW
jgi:hypothetical protein